MHPIATREKNVIPSLYTVQQQDTEQDEVGEGEVAILKKKKRV